MTNALAYCTAVFIAKVKLFRVQTLFYFCFVVIKREIFKVFPEGTTKQKNYSTINFPLTSSHQAQVWVRVRVWAWAWAWAWARARARALARAWALALALAQAQARVKA